MNRYRTVIIIAISLCGGAAAVEDVMPVQPQAMGYAGVTTLKLADPGLDGSGVKIAVICRSTRYVNGEPQNDYRPMTAHNCFAGSRFVFRTDSDPAGEPSPHSTAICSILLGNDPNACAAGTGRFRYLGAAPAAEAQIYEFWDFLSTCVFGHKDPAVDVITAGIGNEFEDWWTRGIDSLAQHYGITVVAAIGNGEDSGDPPLYPAAAANCIGVGVVDSVATAKLDKKLADFALVRPEHSTTGPTSDARCKPDIVTAGNCLVADYRSVDSYQPAGDWSSFATPVAAGSVALIIQGANRYGLLADTRRPKGTNCLVKAILMNSAEKLPYWHKGILTKSDDHAVPLDYSQGAGALDAAEAFRHINAGRHNGGEVPEKGWDLNELEPAGSAAKTYILDIDEPAGKRITATLAWNRHYSKQYPFERDSRMDSDLRIELWGVDEADPAANLLIDYSDSRADNVEHIYSAAEPGRRRYHLVVTRSGLESAGRPCLYALAWSVVEEPRLKGPLWYDLNCDGTIDEHDLMKMLENLLNSMAQPERYYHGDINEDGLFDLSDVQVLMQHKSIRRSLAARRK